VWTGTLSTLPIQTMHAGLLACVWPDTHRLDRTAAAIELAQDDPPTVVAGDAHDVLPSVLAGLPEGAVAAVVTTWAVAYFSIEDRRRFIELLKAESLSRPITWLSAENRGIVDAFAGGDGPDQELARPDVLGAVTFECGSVREQLLGFVHRHGSWIDWRAPPHPG
jgi:hypothetical protein